MAADKDIDPNGVGVSPDRNAVLNDSEMDGLSLYEKKVLLVNRELDSHGMGKYQVWFQPIQGKTPFGSY